MSEAGASASPDAQRFSEDGSAPPTAALGGLGAYRFDPVRLRYIEALARKAAAHTGEARRSLDRKLEAARAEYDVNHARARSQAAEAVSESAARFPGAADDLHRLFSDGDFGGIRRLTERLEERRHTGLLGQLVRYIDGNGVSDANRPDHGPAASGGGLPAELKALREFKSTWTQLGVQRQLARSLAKAPAKPGPLNSHLLVLRSLQWMQAAAPAYLNRFIAHVDTLMWLEQAEISGAPNAVNGGRRDVDRKRRSSRGKTT